MQDTGNEGQSMMDIVTRYAEQGYMFRSLSVPGEVIGEAEQTPFESRSFTNLDAGYGISNKEGRFLVRMGANRQGDVVIVVDTDMDEQQFTHFANRYFGLLGGEGTRRMAEEARTVMEDFYLLATPDSGITFSMRKDRYKDRPKASQIEIAILGRKIREVKEQKRDLFPMLSMVVEDVSGHDIPLELVDVMVKSTQNARERIMKPA